MTDWTKPTRCNGNSACPEWAVLPDGNVALRNSEAPDVVLIFTRVEWDAFKAGVQAGEFDLAALALPMASGPVGSGEGSEGTETDEGPVSVAR